MDAKNFCNFTRKEKNLSAASCAPYSHAKRILEALLFSCSEPLALHKMHSILGDGELSIKEVHCLLKELKEEYRQLQRSFALMETPQGWQLKALSDFAPYLERLHEGRLNEKLSMAATEVLAIIAYRGPITKPGVEQIRGVDSSSIIQSLQERGLIEPVGKQESPGRPTLWAVTSRFLTHYGLQSPNDLPRLE